MLALALAGTLAFGVAACGDDEESSAARRHRASSGGGGEVSGKIAIDGSSTVAPFAEAAAELFQEENPDVQITVGTSGTGGGFEKFCAGETDISDASRAIKDDEEVPVCEKNGVTYGEVQIANDGIAVASSKQLTVDCLTTDQLKQIWNKGSKVASLADVDPSLPDTELSLYGPGTDSGTFDFFTDEINGEEGVSREDYEASEDDNQLVTGVSGDEGGLGYFGFSYYEGAADQLNLVGVDSGDGNCVKPSVETIQDGSYKPLSRPLFMYPSEKAMGRPEVKAFMEFVVAQAAPIAEAAKIVPLTDGADRRRPRKSSPRPRAPPSNTRGRLLDSRLRRRDGAPDQPGPAPHAAARASRAPSGSTLFGAAVVSVLTTLAIIFSLLRETISFFGDVPIGDFLFGTKWTPQFAGDQQSFGVLPLVWGTLYLTGDRPARRDPGRDPLGHVPERVRAAPGAQGRSSRSSRCWPACRRSSSATSP